MKVLFLDTVVFLQCKELSQIPWHEVAEGEDLLLLVPRPAQEEIDRLKQDGSSRRAKRARKASSLLRNIILEPQSKIIISDSNPRVQASFTPQLDPNRAVPVNLDMSRSDDRIIEEALAYREEHPEDEVAILTHDTNPLLTAKRFGLAYVVVPDEWLLPPEPDQKEKKIAELERKIEELRRAYPNITVVAQDAAGNTIRSFNAKVVQYAAISESEMDALISEARSKYPIATRFHASEPERPLSFALIEMEKAMGVETTYEPPKPKAIEDYTNIEYPEWLENVRKSFKSLPKILEKEERHFQVCFSISNSGRTPAEHVVVEFRAHGGLLFSPPADRGDQSVSVIEFPDPPTPPIGRWIRGKSFIASMMDLAEMAQVRPSFASPIPETMSRIGPTRPRDRLKFYWKPNRPSRYEESRAFEWKNLGMAFPPSFSKSESLFP